MSLNGRYRIHTFTATSAANHHAETLGELLDAVLFAIKYGQQFEIKRLVTDE